jgi:hypothetical protein
MKVRSPAVNSSDDSGVVAAQVGAGEELPLRVGSTLICPTCGIGGVVRALSNSPAELPSCHGPMRVARPVPCSEVRPRSATDAMLGGALYRDVTSGFEFWCTRGGPQQIRIGDHALLPHTLVAVS